MILKMTPIQLINEKKRRDRYWQVYILLSRTALDKATALVLNWTLAL